MYRKTLGPRARGSVKISRSFLESPMEKTWLKQYPAGVPANINVEQYNSLVALLDESFKKYAGRTVYKFMLRAPWPPTCKRRGWRRVTASHS
jgi:hypothetical protein